jgi:hypothetical protein
VFFGDVAKHGGIMANLGGKEKFKQVQNSGKKQKTVDICIHIYFYIYIYILL